MVDWHNFTVFEFLAIAIVQYFLVISLTAIFGLILRAELIRMEVVVSTFKLFGDIATNFIIQSSFVFLPYNVIWVFSLS
jgi:hypothetical protein